MASLLPPSITEQLDRALARPISCLQDDLLTVDAELCRRSFSRFVRLGWTAVEPGQRLIWGWHLQAICDDIQALFEEFERAKSDESYRQRLHNYLCNVPPRTGKSTILSVFFPAWVWLRRPETTIRCMSSNPDVSIRDADAGKALLESEWYQDIKHTLIAAGKLRPWEMRKDLTALSWFGNTVGGVRRSKGWSAKITGTGTDIIIADDPHDAEEANSEKKRKGVCDKWTNSIRNRVNDPRAHMRIGIMQRLHEDDWTGYVVEREPWWHRIIPQEFDPEADDICRCRSCKGELEPLREWSDPRTEAGELLQPDRFDRVWVDAEKESLGSYAWAGQHGQRPAPDDGGRFKWSHWRFWKPDGIASASSVRPRRCFAGPARALPASFDEIVISVDCAFKDLDTSDRVAMFVIGRLGADRYILDRRVGRYGFSKTIAVLVELCDAWPRAGAKLIEDKANGSAVVNHLCGEIPGMIAVNPEGGKESRAAILEPSVEAGNWYLPDGAPWLEDFCHEFAVFPNGSHDDQLDAVSQAAVRFALSPHAARIRRAFGGGKR